MIGWIWIAFATRKFDSRLNNQLIETRDLEYLQRAVI